MGDCDLSLQMMVICQLVPIAVPAVVVGGGWLCEMVMVVVPNAPNQPTTKIMNFCRELAVLLVGCLPLCSLPLIATSVRGCRTVHQTVKLETGDGVLFSDFKNGS